VISAEEADQTVDEVWSSMEKYIPELSRDKPHTWYNWASLAKVGILGNMPIMFPQCLQNRQNERVYRAFRALYGKDELTVSMDRIGMMRPTVNVKAIENEPPRDMPPWKTISEWLHWDMNPWTGLTSTAFWAPAEYSENSGYKILKVQGVLGLVDCRDEDGGFHTVPGFHRHINGWAWKNRDNRPKHVKPLETTFQIPEDDPIRADVQHVPIRKGSILIWDSRMPHGSYPNSSERFRIIQYLKMGDALDPAFSAFYVDGLLPEGFGLTDLGAKLFGLKSWH